MDTVGKKLQEARLAKRLEVEQVSEATKIRPERILDLEADEYSHFPNLTYAKSFLAKYAKFLGVEIQEQLDHFQVSDPKSLSGYRYFNSKSMFVPEQPRLAPKGFRVPPLVITALLGIVLVGVPLFSYLAVNIPRLNATKETRLIPLPSEEAALPAPTQTESTNVNPAPTAAGPPEAKPPDAPKSDETNSARAETTAALAPVLNRGEDTVETKRSSRTKAMPDAGSKADLTAMPEKKLEVRVLRKTWLKVIRDEEGTHPVFEGSVSPQTRPIVVEGKRFWVQVSDKAAIELRKNGQPVLGSSEDLVIN